MKRTILLLLMLLACNANADWIDKQGVRLPDAEDRKAVGDFGAHLVLVADERIFLKKWTTPSETVDINTVESVAINQPINAFVLFSACKPAANGLCNVSMRFRVIQPDGKLYSETPKMEVWQNKPPPPARILELSVQYLKIVVEPHEQRGRYTVQAYVSDDNTGMVLSLQKAFSATDIPPSEKHHPAPQGGQRKKQRSALTSNVRSCKGIS